MKKILLTLLLVSCLSAYLSADPAYKIYPRNDVILATAALGINGISLFFDSGSSDVTAKSQVNSFDQLLMFDYSRNQDDISTAASVGLLLLPVITPMIQYNDMNNWLTYAVMYTEAFLLTHGTKELLKSTIPRNRPYSIIGDIPEGEGDDYYNSFPSGHTSYAFLGATFLSTTYSTEYPDSSWRLPIILASYGAATSVGIMRITSGNHYISDVIAGAAIGTLYGWLVPRLHLAKQDKNAVVYVTPQRDSISLSILLRLD